MQARKEYLLKFRNILAGYLGPHHHRSAQGGVQDIET